MLPHFVHADFQDVIRDTNESGVPLQAAWFAPHLEFRFPIHGAIDVANADGYSCRTAPSHRTVVRLLGEEHAMRGGTARYVDSSVERM